LIKIRINKRVVGTYEDIALQSNEKLFTALKLHLVVDWDRIEVLKIAKKNKQIKAKINKNVLQKA
jgi:hypothetical protein